jgi:hypothetical protein
MALPSFMRAISFSAKTAARQAARGHTRPYAALCAAVTKDIERGSNIQSSEKRRRRPRGEHFQRQQWRNTPIVNTSTRTQAGTGVWMHFAIIVAGVSLDGLTVTFNPTVVLRVFFLLLASYRCGWTQRGAWHNQSRALDHVKLLCFLTILVNGSGFVVAIRRLDTKPHARKGGERGAT